MPSDAKVCHAGLDPASMCEQAWTPGQARGDREGGQAWGDRKSVVFGATQTLVMSVLTPRFVMPDLIRHPCVNRHGPRVKPGVTEKRFNHRVVEKMVKPGVIKRNVLVHGHGTHIRATPNVLARGWRVAASKQVSRQKLSTLRVSRGSITPSSSTRPLV
jgi:hypothetical protein